MVSWTTFSRRLDMPATHRKSIVAPVFFATLGIVVLVGLGAVMLRSVAQWAGTDSEFMTFG